jgi:glycosyltransferase involved in cell wall biosynthesis
VEAARLVVDRHPEARFFLAGEGPVAACDSKARRSASASADRFVFVGFVKDVATTLSAFDLSVFPVALGRNAVDAFEALASARPIVATDADGG